MDNEDIKRKLSAIFSADVVGFSRLMGEDEPATITTLNLYKETMGKANPATQWTSRRLYGRQFVGRVYQRGRRSPMRGGGAAGPQIKK